MQYTHALHSYPARMHPGVARSLLELAAKAMPRQRGAVLDPFCGSGTTLVEACSQGFDAIGVDLSPLAVLLARSKTWCISSQHRRHLLRAARDIAGRAIAEGKAARRAGYSAAPFAPKGSDAKARDRALEGCFVGHVRRELEFIFMSIESSKFDPEIADALRVCLSALLVKASRRRSETDRGEKTRHLGRGLVARWFHQRVELLVAGLDDLNRDRRRHSRVHVIGADARTLDAKAIAPDSIGAIVTSPPYGGTYDYADHHALRCAFLGLNDKALRRQELGARRHGRGGSKATAQLEEDMRQVLAALSHVACAGAPVLLMVGDSIVGTQAVRADELVAATGPADLELVAWARQTRPMFGARERDAFGSRGKHEHVLLLRKQH